nr:hypothetical protein [Parasulfuritortus cantonensis]
MADAVGRADHRVGTGQQGGQAGQGLLAAAVVVDQAHAQAFRQLPVLRQQRGTASDAQHAAVAQPGRAGRAFARTGGRLRQPQAFQGIPLARRQGTLLGQARYLAGRLGQAPVQFGVAGGESSHVVGQRQQATRHAGHGDARLQGIQADTHGRVDAIAPGGRGELAFQLAQARVAPRQLAGMAGVGLAGRLDQTDTFGLQPAEAAQIRGLARADLVRQHVYVGIDRLATGGIARLVGQRGPHGTRDLAPFAVFTPQRQELVRILGTLETAYRRCVLAVQPSVHGFRERISRT